MFEDWKERADFLDREYREFEDRWVRHESGEVFKVVAELGGVRRPHHEEGWNGQPTWVLEAMDGSQLEVHPDNPHFKRIRGLLS